MGIGLLNYDGKCKYLHGHNGRAVIVLEGESLDDRGMLLDFSDIKRVVSRWIDDQLDHRMLLHRDDPVVPVLREMGEPSLLARPKPHGREYRQADFRVHGGAGLSDRRGASVGNAALLCDVPRLSTVCCVQLLTGRTRSRCLTAVSIRWTSVASLRRKLQLPQAGPQYLILLMHPSSIGNSTCIAWLTWFGTTALHVHGYVAR